jgi:hypothetical protein
MSDLRMNAYYYGFEPTECRDVDLILSAVACAGKGFHNTSEWNEEISEYYPFKGTSYVTHIQNAAIDAAAKIKELEQKLAIAKEALEFIMVYKSPQYITTSRGSLFDVASKALKQLSE